MVEKGCIAVRYHVARAGWRWDISLTTQLATEAGRTVWINLRNISATGFMAESPVAPPVGEKLRVLLPGSGPVLAEVRWSQDGRLGCRFERPLSPLAVALELLGVAKSWLLSKI